MNHPDQNDLSILLNKTNHIEEFIIEQNERLVEAGQDSANRAFNIGCTAGLIPAIMVTVITLIITKGSWIATGLIGILMLMGLIAFANLSAYISRSRAYQRCYQQEVLPDIETELDELGLAKPNFLTTVNDVLSPESPLRDVISMDSEIETSSMSR